MVAWGFLPLLILSNGVVTDASPLDGEAIDDAPNGKVPTSLLLSFAQLSCSSPVLEAIPASIPTGGTCGMYLLAQPICNWVE